MPKYRIIQWLMVAVLMAPLLAQAGSNDEGLGVSNYLRSGSLNTLGLKPLGFLDPSRMNFQTSYSMSYATSGGQSLMQGLFMETIGYRLANPLSLTLNLGFQHTPYSSFGPDGVSRNTRFVGGAALDWHPTQNMFLHFEVANFPSYGVSQYNPYWRPFPYSSPYNSPNDPSQSNSESQSK